MVLKEPRQIDTFPLSLENLPFPEPTANQIRIKIHTCGICHTDLHIVEGELDLPKLPIIPGHQIIGSVERVGDKVSRFKSGDRVGVPWLYSTCGICDYCTNGNENLCDAAKFTGLNANGGFTEYMVISENYAYEIPKIFSDVEAAPLLCGGIIGFRTLRLSAIQPGGRLGLFGFGSSAHIAIQVAKHWDYEVYVFTRNIKNQELAQSLGAVWVGQANEIPPFQLDSAIIFAPNGELVPLALKVLRKGGTVTLAGIYMSPIPQLEYPLLYHERAIRSIANSTRKDVEDFLNLAAEILIKTKTNVFPLEQANTALQMLKTSQLHGTGVLTIA